jgi:hypothetical protein
MLRTTLILFPVVLLAGCISVSSTKPAASADSPNYSAFCQERETQCRQSCGSAGVQAFSCKAAPSEGLDYQCQCKKAEPSL